MLTAISIGSSALIPAHTPPRCAIRAIATAAEPIVGSQWLGAAANVLLDSTLSETTDEKVAALLEAGCPQTAIDSCLKNFALADASPAMKDSQWLGGAANVLLDSTLSETTDEKVAALLEAGCPQGAIDSCLKNFVLGPSVVVTSWYDSGLRMISAEPAAPAAVASWFDSGVRLTPLFVPALPMPEPEGGWPMRGGSSGYHRMAGRLVKKEAAPATPAQPGVLKSFASFFGRVFKTKKVAPPPAKEAPVAASAAQLVASTATATAPTATLEVVKAPAAVKVSKPVPKIKLPKKKAMESVPDALGRYEYEASKAIF